MRILSGRFHKEEFRTQSVRAHLGQHAPGVLRRAAHCITECVPLLLRLESLLLTSGGCRRGRHIEVLLILLRSLRSGISINVHGDNFSEEAVGVISQIVRIGQDLLHATCSLVSSVSLLSLLDEHILQTAGICVQNSRGLDSELPNDLGAGGAECGLAVRRSLRGSLGL
mgnify:CR=1 FL=1